jgi:hypothetical protein
MSDSIGDLYVGIGADISNLDAQLNAAVGEVKTAGAEMASAFETGAGSADTLARSEKQVEDASRGVSSGLHESSESISEFAGEALKLAGIALTLEALKEAAMECAHAFAEEEMSLIALTAILGGSAEAGEEALHMAKALADEFGQVQDAVVRTTQQLLALKLPLKDIPRVIEGIDTSARAMNVDFQTAASRFEQMANSGQLMGRSMTALGLSIDDIGKALGMMGESQDEIKKKFAALGDETQRFRVLAEAAINKFPGLAEQAGKSVESVWTRVKNATKDAMEEVGKQLTSFDFLSKAATIAAKFLTDIAIELIGILKQLGNVLVGLWNIGKDVFIGLGKAIDDAVHGNMAGALDAVKSMGSAVATDFNKFLDNVKNDWKSTSASIDKIWSGTATNIKKTSGDLKLTFKENDDEMLKSLASFAEGVDKLLGHVPATYKAYADALQTGGKAASAMLSEVQAQIDNAITMMNKMRAIPQSLLVEFGKLKQAQAQLKEFADQDVFYKIAQQVDQIVAKYPAQLAQLDIATLNWVNAMQAAARDIPAALNTMSDSEVLEKWLKSMKDLAASADTLQASYSKAVGKMHEDAISQVQITVDWRDRLNDVGRAGMELEGLMTKFHVANIADLQQEIADLQNMLNLMQQFGKPLSMQLETQTKIIEDQIRINELTGASGEATLAWTEALEGVRVKQDLLRDHTMALSDLYTSMVHAFGEAWHQVSSGIADAIVSGQNFGQVFMNVIDTLKKQLTELVVDYLMKLLKDAIVTNTGLLQGFNGVFNSLFGGGSGGVVMSSLNKTIATTQQAGDAMSKALSDMASKVNDLAKTTTAGVQQVGQAATTTFASIFSMVTGAISAITGIIGVFQSARQEGTLNAIEQHTKVMAITLAGIAEPWGKVADGQDTLMSNLHDIRNFASDLLKTFQSYIGYFGDLEGKIDDISGAVMKIADLLRDANGWLHQIADTLANGHMQTAAAGGAGPTTVNVTINAAPDVKSIADALWQELLNRGLHL